MSDSSFTHETQQDRKLRIPWFSWVVWTLGVLAGGASFVAIGFVGLVVLPVAFAIGLPIKNIGVPHDWVQRKWERHTQWRRDHGIAMAPPLTRDDKDEPSKIERAQFVNARILEAQGDEVVSNFLPVLTTEERAYGTFVLALPGASETWLGSDHYGKYEWELFWIEQMAHAVGVTTIDVLELAFTRVHRPTNRETGLSYAYRRGNPEVFASEDDESVYGMAANNIADRYDIANRMSGQPREYCFVRTQWPRKLGVKIGLDDAAAFKGSALYRTGAEVLEAYDSAGIDASFLTPDGTQNMWDYFWRIKGIHEINMREARDKAIAASLQARGGTVEPREDLVTPGEIRLDKGVSIRYPKPGTPGFINYNGTYHIAGYVTGFKFPSVRAGFKRELALPDDVYFASTVYVEARRRDAEKRKAREKERAMKMMESQSLFERGLSDPEGGRRIQAVIERRAEIAMASNRVSRHNFLESVAADSLEEAENRWDDYVWHKGRLGYNIERVDDPVDIEDILLAQLGIGMD